MKTLLPLTVIVVACSHGSSASHSATELKQASLNLNQGMAGSQIQQVLGPPDETGSSPCGSGGGEQCTVWTYRAQQADLHSSMNLRLWLQGEPLTLERWEWF
ncbi:MAG: hypothetical protein ACXWLL_12485 [Myxococcaceae bacterium]